MSTIFNASCFVNLLSRRSRNLLRQLTPLHHGLIIVRCSERHEGEARTYWRKRIKKSDSQFFLSNLRDYSAEAHKLTSQRGLLVGSEGLVLPQNSQKNLSFRVRASIPSSIQDFSPCWGAWHEGTFSLSSPKSEQQFDSAGIQGTSWVSQQM